MSDHDPFSDPFSPDPFSAAPVAPTPAAVPPIAPPPPAASTARNLPPAPTPVVAPAKPAEMSPVTVFFGSYAFAGIAAVLLATAIALIVAPSDFHTSTLMVVAVAVAAVLVAAIVLWLVLFDERGRRWARTATWAVCGLAVCAAVAVFVLEPGSSVSWFGQLAQFGAGLTIVVTVASALLLALPASNAYFRAEPKAEPKPPKVPAAWTPPQPQASPSPAPPTAAPDDDPFS